MLKFRNLSLTCPELERGRFAWRIFESPDGGHEWHQIEGYEGELFKNWDDAWKAGSVAIREIFLRRQVNWTDLPEKHIKRD